MILLMDLLNSKNYFMMQSIINENDNCLCIACNDDNIRFNNTVSICEYYAIGENIENVGSEGKTYFLQACVPDEYQITYYDETHAVIKNNYGIVAYIYYMEPMFERYVDRIEWISESGKVEKTDYYAHHNHRYYSEEYRCGSDGQQFIINKIWYDEKGNEKLSWSNISNCYFAYEFGVISNIMTNINSIEVKVFESIGEQEICITESKQLSMLINAGVKDFSKVTCAIQTIEELHNIRVIEDTRNIMPKVNIYISNEMSNVELRDNERKVKYRTARKSSDGLRNGIMILTSTEDVVEIERLVGDFSDITFYIAAHTMVSPRLANLDLLENVHVIPGLAENDLEYYLNKCDYFLDITHGDEAYNCCTKALMDGLLIVGYEDTVRKREYINPDYLFSAWDYDAMSAALRECIDNPDCYWAALHKQSMVV